MTADRVLLVVLDGLGDRPVPELDDRTPLEVAGTPTMDGLAAAGATATVDILEPGLPPGSDTGHLALLGFEPSEVYTGRGPFEAYGVGVEIGPDDVALRANFATLADDGTVADRRAGRIEEGTDALAATLDGETFEGTRVRLHPSTAHRAALILEGPGLDHRIGDVDPHAAGEPPHACEPLVDTDAARRTARAVDAVVEASRKRFPEVGTPANVLLPRGAGVLEHDLSVERRWGVDAACVAGVGLVKGVARAAGMTMVDVPGATGGLDTDVVAKAEASVEALGAHDLVLLNVKAPDLCGHDGLHEEKVDVFERIDAALGEAGVDDLDDAIVVVTGDHATPVVARAHTGDPLPVLFAGPGVLPDGVDAFDERSCRAGGLGRLRGPDLLRTALDLCNRVDKFGA